MDVRVIPSERSESRNRSRPDREPFGQDDGDSSTAALRAFARNDGPRCHARIDITAQKRLIAAIRARTYRVFAASTAIHQRSRIRC